jgi:hypothetical protein
LRNISTMAVGGLANRVTIAGLRLRRQRCGHVYRCTVSADRVRLGWLSSLLALHRL